jgi:diacylglycerol kinase (ATP)
VTTHWVRQNGGWRCLPGENALIGVIFLLMAVELLNTAIEKLSDHVTPARHPDIGRIKDIASAAVGVALAIAGLTWLLAIAERLGLI